MHNARTIWVFREALKGHDLVNELFAQSNGQITAAGYIHRHGQIVDTSMVAARSLANATAAKVPEGWEEKPNILRKKDRDACWIKNTARPITAI